MIDVALQSRSKVLEQALDTWPDMCSRDIRFDTQKQWELGENSQQETEEGANDAVYIMLS